MWPLEDADVVPSYFLTSGKRVVSRDGLEVDTVEGVVINAFESVAPFLFLDVMLEGSVRRKPELLSRHEIS